MLRFFSWASVAALLAGCGPTLDQVTRTTQGFAIQQRCAQGPFELHVPAFGSKWGEDVTLEARGKAIDGRSTITVDGQTIREVPFSGGAVDASACVLSDADRAAAVTGGPPVQMPNASTNSSTTTTNTSTSGSVALLPAGVPNVWIATTQVAKYHVEVDDWSKASWVLKKGQDMKIVFWSDHPLDLGGTTFVLTHSEMVPPNGDEKKWQAHLDDVKSDAAKKLAEAQVEAKKAHEEAEAKGREQARCENLDGHDDKCAKEKYKTRTERVAYAELQRRCEELAARNATDSACRDDGWRNDNERPDYRPETHVTNLALAEPAPHIDAKPQGRQADRPPPAPQAEAQSPKPSEHAEWIPGSWQWNGFDWVWLAGGWRVPEQDRTQHLTATAPSAPPATRVEVHPPQPITTAVWAEGYWHWSAGQWIWVPGHWAVPPRAGATWRPSTWVPEGVQLRLDPGGWR